MKNFLKHGTWIILLVLIFTGYLVHAAPCTRPITYRIGTFDTNFGITEDEYKEIIKQAGEVWGKPTGKDLFQYDPKGEMTVNLIYDTRQATTEQNKVLESKANQTKETADSVKADYLALETKYNSAKNSYSTLASQYSSAQSTYNSKVDYYNNHGGAPRAEYNALVAEKARLSDLSKTLEAKRIDVNSLAVQINARIHDYNVLVDQANQNINTINQSAGKEFNEGEYVSDKDGKRINIYEFTSRNELKRVLAHELGHALGMMHGTDPDSIMYYLNKSPNLVPTAEDKAMLNKICGVK